MAIPATTFPISFFPDMIGKLSWVSPGLFVSHIVRELFLMLFDVSLDELRKILERIRQDRDLSVPYEGYFHLMKDLVKELTMS